MNKLDLQLQGDGIHSMVSRDHMNPSAKKLRDVYALKPNAPFYHKTFGLWMCIDKWYEEGLDRDADLNELFMLDEPWPQTITKREKLLVKPMSRNRRSTISAISLTL